MCGKPVAPAVSRPQGLCGGMCGGQESAGGTGREADGPEAVWREGWRQALERSGRETLGSRKPWKSLTRAALDRRPQGPGPLRPTLLPSSDASRIPYPRSGPAVRPE